MKRRKDVIENVSLVFKDSIIQIYCHEQELFFEIGNEITTDVAEAVAIIMRNTHIKKSEIWNTEIKYRDISPTKCLYWLSGGDEEWINLDHYNAPWCMRHIDFENEYKDIIYEIIDNSKTLGDIRNGFNKYLNLLTIYDFAINKGLLK